MSTFFASLFPPVSLGVGNAVEALYTPCTSACAQRCGSLHGSLQLTYIERELLLTNQEEEVVEPATGAPAFIPTGTSTGIRIK